MQIQAFIRKRIDIFYELIELGLHGAPRKEALQRLTQLAGTALDSDVCNLVLLDLNEKKLWHVACARDEQTYQEFFLRRPLKLGSSEAGDFLDYNLFMKGEGGPRYNLQAHGQGIINSAVAQKYNLNSAFSAPIKPDGRLIGYLNHFTSRTEFSSNEFQTLKLFARHAEVIIDRAEQSEYTKTLERSQSISLALQQSLLSVTDQQFLRQVSQKARELLEVPICIVWRLDQQKTKLTVAATAGDVNARVGQLQMDLSRRRTVVKKLLRTSSVRYVPDIADTSTEIYPFAQKARAAGWVSLLSAPMRVENRLIGFLDVFTRERRYFKQWEQEFFRAFANYTAFSIQKTELLHEVDRHSAGRQRLAKLGEIMQQVAEATDEDKLYSLLLNKSLELVRAERGWISSYDLTSGDLYIKTHQGHPSKVRPLKLGQGITGRSLETESSINVTDVRAKRWQGVYEEFWNDTRSELVVPLVVTNAEVRKGETVQQGSKVIGVINMESPQVRAFTADDESAISTLGRHAANILEHLQADQKQEKLRRFEREIANKRDWDETIRVVLEAITDTLGYEYVNLSMASPETNRIRSSHVKGVKDEVTFKRMADYPLNGKNIHAAIYRSGKIEVPAENDTRLDRELDAAFALNDLIRVFIPLKLPSDKSWIGTVEAGYRRGYRKYIYESDVQILSGFVCSALEQKKRGLLPKISHEFTAPIVGIRGNASFLLRWIKTLDDKLIQRKFEDILADCEILLHKVGELEHILGGASVAPVPSKKELTFVYRDIIIKTVNQLKPLIAERKLDISQIIYSTTDTHRIRLYVDKPKLNSVVYNLLINSIKYAESNPADFKISINLEEDKDFYVFIFRDWGIGIKPEYTELVFEDGFRAPEASRSNVTGSGLGLTIARKIMRELGGELSLVKNSKPTEFRLSLPKPDRGEMP